MTADPVPHMVQELLADAEDDWVGLWRIPQGLRRIVPDVDDAEIRRLGERVIRGLIAGGLHIGDLVSGRGFVPWTDGTNVDALLDLWERRGRDPNLSDDIWFGFPSSVRPASGLQSGEAEGAAHE